MADPVLYLLMRNDLPSLGPGKLAAQAAHVAVAFVYENQKSNIYKEWCKQTTQGFGTKICLAGSRTDIELAVAEADYSFCAGVVNDPTYPCEIPYEVAVYLMDEDNLSCTIGVSDGKGFMLRDEMVGAYIIGFKSDPKLAAIVSKFSLYP